MRRSLTIGLITFAFAPATDGSAAVAAGHGALDPAFGGGSGSVEIPIPGATSSAFAAVATQGSKILAAGWKGTSTGPDFAVARLRAGGAPDDTFSGDGVATTHFYSHGDTAESVVPMSGGRALAVGYTYHTTADDTGRFALAMFRADGTLDPSFGFDGKVITRFPNMPAYGYTAALQADGKIVVGGELYQNSNHNGSFAFARYRPNGRLDPTFGGDGRVAVNVLKKDDGVWTVRVLPNGKILAAGWSTQVYPAEYRTSVVRLLPNGKLDPTFSGDGKVAFDVLGTTSNYGLGLAVRPSGRSVVSVWDDAETGPEVIQVTADGHLDTSFGGGDGVARFARAPSYAETLALQDDGKIVVVGVDDFELAVFRFTKGGARDTGYGANGETMLGSSSYGYGITIDGQGRALAIGSVSGSDVVARLLP